MVASASDRTRLAWRSQSKIEDTQSVHSAGADGLSAHGPRTMIPSQQYFCNSAHPMTAGMRGSVSPGSSQPASAWTAHSCHRLGCGPRVRKKESLIVAQLLDQLDPVDADHIDERSEGGGAGDVAGHGDPDERFA